VILDNRKQEYLVNEQKVKMQAAKAFNKQLWGNTHPYAQYAEESDFDTLTSSHLKAFYKKAYTPANCTLFVAGKVNDDVIAIIDKYLCVGWEGGNRLADMAFSTNPIDNKRTFTEKDGVQSAIRMGCHVIGKGHPDFPAFQVLNTVLGGYFGSRLMRNIREDKGYTYGIGSYIVSQPLGSYLSISTETDNVARENVINEIYSELKALQNEPVGEAELQMVKNYMSGELMRSFDGPFAIIDVYRALWEMDLNFNYFKDYLEAIEATTPESLQALAQKWLNPNDFYIAMAGKAHNEIV
jgi:predicted Zn-dependent peptidase